MYMYEYLQQPFLKEKHFPYFEAEFRIRIRIVFRSWIWIRIRIKVKIQKLSRNRMKPWRAVDTQNGGLEAQKYGGLKG
jgi:hypothetical protein